MPDPRIFPITSVEDTFATVGVVSTLVLATNTRRVDTEIVNDGDETVYLARGNAAVMGSGIRINARGGSYRIGTNNMFYGEIYAICESGQLNLTISEGYL